MMIRSRMCLAFVLMVAAVTGGCAAGGDAMPEVAEAPVGTSAGSSGGRTPLAGFGEITVTVVDADGKTRTFCLLLADTDDRRRRGLMHVTDPGLGGFAGMAFTYEQDETGGFWMRNTRLALSIAWIRADGTTVSTADMPPCPDHEASCPVYSPAGPYRLAVEVPQGRLDDLGISPRSRVALGAPACAGP